MIIHESKPLFAWDCLDDSPSLATVRGLLAAIPDGELLAALRIARGKGRNDYPVSALWGTFVLRIILRHVHMDGCLAELKRNEGLRRLIGVHSEEAVPKGWNMSRFEEVLGQEPHRTLLKAIFNQMVHSLGLAVEDLGKDTAGDATALSSRASTPAKVKAELAEGLSQPSGGRKEYLDDNGVVTKVVEWFGYKLHLLVDVKHEVALSYEITDSKEGDGETIPKLVRQAKAILPPNRIRTLAYDKAADINDAHEFLSKERIRPVIENRSLWKEDLERMLPGHDGNSNIVYDEAGTVYCYDRESQPIVRHKMAYIGYEPQRETIKYRCPAMHEGWFCPMSDICNAGKKYGKTIRVRREVDLRRFPAIPRATKQFERLYHGRSAVERVNGRLKIFWGVDDGNSRGAWRFAANVGAVMIVHAAFATVLASMPRKEGTTLGGTKLSPIAKAIQAQIALRRAHTDHTP